MLMDDFIDLVLEDHLEVSSTDSTYTAQRTRVKRAAQAALQIIYLADDWDFKYVTGGTTTLTAGAYSAVAPSGFMQVGHNGSVWLQNDIELERADPRWVNRIRKERGTTERAKPQFYAVAGQDSSTKRPLLIFDALSDATYTVELDYEKVCPTLVDDSGATNGLDTIPDEHVLSVLLPATVELLASGQGDGRVVGELGPRGKAALASMKAHRNQQRPDDSRLGDMGLNRYGMH